MNYQVSITKTYNVEASGPEDALKQAESGKVVASAYQPRIQERSAPVTRVAPEKPKTAA